MTTRDDPIETLLQDLGRLVAEVERPSDVDGSGAVRRRPKPAPAPLSPSPHPEPGDDAAWIEELELEAGLRGSPDERELALALERCEPLSGERLEHIVDSVMATLAAPATSTEPALSEPRPGSTLASETASVPRLHRPLGGARAAASVRGWKASAYWPQAMAALVVASLGVALWSEPESDRAKPKGPDGTTVTAPNAPREPVVAVVPSSGPRVAPLNDDPPLPMSRLESDAKEPRIAPVAPGPRETSSPPDLGLPARSLAEPASVPGARAEPPPFSLKEATAGLGDKGSLFALMHTEMGVIQCELWPERAPLTVANFVGLARGLRPFKDPESGVWTKRRFYDATTFHRVIPGFLIQGGDPTGTGTGNAGYTIADEHWKADAHDKPGLLCMANRGVNTASSQFFILDRDLSNKPSHLDESYTVFGSCTPLDVIGKLARVATVGDRPVSPPRLERMEIVRSPRVAKPMHHLPASRMR
jgi:peptidyl-prolyl cis-trans isomerase A (cyclophilin A)